MLRIRRFLTVVATVAIAAGCSTPAASTAPSIAASSAPSTAASAGDDNVVIGFSQANGGDEWRVNQTNNVRDNCAKIPGAEVVITDAQGDDAKQAADVDDLIARGVDVLLMTPNTADALTPAAKKALDAGIPVITLDRGVNVDVTQHIGADNKLIGKTAAEYVSKTILEGNGGKVIEIQGTTGASATVDRNEQFVQWLKDNDPKVEIVASQTADYKRDQALVVMNDFLQRFGPDEVDVIYTHNDAMALGVVQALETAGRLKEFTVVGIDGQNEAIQAIKDGKIAVTFTYDNAGKEGCESAGKLVSGEKIDPQWVLETNTIDSTNVDEWIGKGF